MKRLTKESKRDYYKMTKNPIDIFNSKELNRFADKLVDKFGNITDYDKFVDKAMKWLDFDLDESEMISAEALTELGYDKDDFDAGDGTYEEALYDFIDKVWDYMEDSYYVESKKIMKEENENLKFVKSFKVLKIPFSEIGYFGKSNWRDAMEFAKNNKKGWRLPNEDESILISEHFEDTAKELVWDTDFYFWTNEEDDDTHAISSYVGATEVTPIHLSLKDDINCVFLVK